MTETVKLAGEAAELFDHQMDVDRELMLSSNDCVAFRPVIPGEFDQALSFGFVPPRIVLEGFEQKEHIPETFNQWVCVVDIMRAVGTTNIYSGGRMRIPCPPPLTQEIRDQMRNLAIEIAKDQFYTLQELGRKAKTKPSAGATTKGFGTKKRQH